MQIMQPAKDPSKPVDESQAASQNVLKFLPLMIGWFSLSVPSALGLYWILNNFVSTATSVFIRNQIAAETGDPNAKPPKISLPFMEEEPEVVTMPIPRDALADSAATETKGFAPTGVDAEVDGEIVQQDGSPAPAVAVASEPKAKVRQTAAPKAKARTAAEPSKAQASSSKKAKKRNKKKKARKSS
ncbi:unnamed protein product [Laminaria digitata]